MIRLIRNFISKLNNGLIMLSARTGKVSNFTVPRTEVGEVDRLIVSNINVGKFASTIACGVNKRIRLYKFGFNSLFSYLMYGSSHVELRV